MPHIKSKLVVANFKMNPTSLTETQELFDFISSVDSKHEIIICPPYIYLSELSKNLQLKTYNLKLSLGSQNCHWEDEGAFTGEVSALMLKDLGVEYVIVGHSERRWKMNETDETINKKLKAAIRNGITPILAVGERNKDDNREEILTSQLKTDLDGVDSVKVIIAYEPVWAIGTGEAETPQHTLEAVKIIKSVVGDVPVLYGGSVDLKNAGDYLNQEGIDGLLVGAASIKKEEFKKIIELD